MWEFFHFFTVFNMGDLPKINGKIGKKFPNRGEGGSPTWEKLPHFPVFFFGNVPYCDLSTFEIETNFPAHLIQACMLYRGSDVMIALAITTLLVVFLTAFAFQVGI